MFNLHVDVSLNPLESAIVDYYSAFYGRGVPAIIRGMIRRHIRSQKNLDWDELGRFAEVFLKKNYPGQATVHQGVREKLQAFEDKVKGRATELSLTVGRDETNLTEGAGMHTIYLSAFELMLVHFRLEKTGNKDSRSGMIRKVISTHAVCDRGLKARSLGHFMRKRGLELDEQEVAKLEREFEVFKRARKKVGDP